MSEKINEISIEVAKNQLETINFENFDQFREFEDSIIHQLIDQPSNYQIRKWQNRHEDMRQIIRPKGFNGPIYDISIQEMKSPADKLVSAREDGFTLLNHYIVHPGIQMDHVIHHASHRMKGYYLTADAYSSANGKVGQILSEIWYVPKPERFCDDYEKNHEEEIIQRYITSPQIINRGISELDCSNQEKAELYGNLGRAAMTKINRAHLTYWDYKKY